MKVKLLVQILLLTLIFVISYLVFHFYFSEKKDLTLKKLEEELTEEINLKDLSSNVIESLEYKSKDNQGNEYVVKSEYAEVNLENQDILILQNVTATINLVGKDPILIFSEFAEYNKSNFDTKFYDGVEVFFEDNIINSNNLDLFFKDNIGSMYSDIRFVNSNSELAADLIDFNLLSGDISVSMYGKEEKIKISKK